MQFWQALSSVSVFINTILLVYIFLGHKIINLWRLLFPKKLFLKIDNTNFVLRCYYLQIQVRMSYRYHEIITGEHKDFEHRNRLYIDAVVFPKDLNERIYKAFSLKSKIQFIDSRRQEFGVLISHLSKIGNKSYLYFIGQKELEHGIVPEGSTFSVQRISDESLLRDIVEKGITDIDINGWDKIYQDKIKPAEKRCNGQIYDPKRKQ